MLCHTSTTGEEHGLFDGSITPFLRILSISVVSISLFPNDSRLGGCLIGLALPVLILCCTLSVLPKSSADFENTS